MPIGNLPTNLSQTILAGIVLVGRLGIPSCMAKAACPHVLHLKAWFLKVSQAAQHVIYVAVRAPSRP